jgi:MYXO-CTERM domain-containing protein
MRNRLLFFTVFVACLFLVPPLVASAADAAPEPDASGLLITAFLVLGFALWRRRRSRRPARAPE